jgi:predicted nuclease of predicted toxin-antitoxin system
LLKLAADENFNNNIVRGILRRQHDADIVRVQDVGLSGARDSIVLEWAAKENRVLLTHDVSTITKYAHERTKLGKPMPGVFEVSRNTPSA